MKSESNATRVGRYSHLNPIPDWWINTNLAQVTWVSNMDELEQHMPSSAKATSCKAAIMVRAELKS